MPTHLSIEKCKHTHNFLCFAGVEALTAGEKLRSTALLQKEPQKKGFLQDGGRGGGELIYEKRTRGFPDLLSTTIMTKKGKLSGDD